MVAGMASHSPESQSHASTWKGLQPFMIGVAPGIAVSAWSVSKCFTVPSLYLHHQLVWVLVAMCSVHQVANTIPITEHERPKANRFGYWWHHIVGHFTMPLPSSQSLVATSSMAIGLCASPRSGFTDLKCVENQWRKAEMFPPCVQIAAFSIRFTLTQWERPRQPSTTW